MANIITKHDTFFQWRKERRMAPILLEVIKEVEKIDDCRIVYQVRWHILGTGEMHTSVFLMMTIDGSFYEFVPIPRKVYLQACRILKENPSYLNARRRVLAMVRKKGTHPSQISVSVAKKGPI